MCKQMMKVILLATVFMVLLTISQVSPVSAAGNEGAQETMGHGAAKDVVVAKVNGQTINMAQLMREMADVAKKKYGSQGISQLLAEKIKQEATDKLIIEELAYQKAAAKVKNVSPQMVDDKLQAVKKTYKNEAEFQNFITAEYGDMESFRKAMERYLTIQSFIAQEFEPKVTVSDAEIKQAYEELKGELFVTDEFVQVNDLTFFLDPDKPESIAQVAKVTKTIEEKYDNNPRKFPSDGSFTMERNVPLDKEKNKALYEKARGLKEYGWSPPVNVDGNLHAVQLVGYKPAVNKSLKEATPYLTNELKKQKRQALINEWMAGLKTGATIEIMDLTR